MIKLGAKAVTSKDTTVKSNIVESLQTQIDSLTTTLELVLDKQDGLVERANVTEH